METAKHLYEYAVVQYVPSVERDEAVNIGLIMMCKRRRWVRCEICLDTDRLLALWPGADINMLRDQCEGICRVAQGEAGAGPLAELIAEERFRWLTAVRSASIRTSRPHPGHTSDLDAEFDRLFDRLVR